jgi:hypothetical protein
MNKRAMMEARRLSLAKAKASFSKAIATGRDAYRALRTRQSSEDLLRSGGACSCGNTYGAISQSWPHFCSRSRAMRPRQAPQSRSTCMLGRSGLELEGLRNCMKLQLAGLGTMGQHRPWLAMRVFYTVQARV